MTIPTKSLTDRLAEYRAQGYTIFEQQYDETQMAEWRAESDRLIAAHPGAFAQPNPWWFGNMLERSPALMWPAVNNSEVLDFAEQVVGPFMQLDNLTLAAFPSMSPEEAGEGVSGWHRDRWSHMPQGFYERPNAMNSICYLQDLTEDFGPLRIVPRSHIEPTDVPQGDVQKRREDEILVSLKAGDVILTHNGLLHSGTPNTSGRTRYFFSVYYNLSWLKYTDTFDGPNCRQLRALARKRLDHRSLRLLGEDDHLQARGNSGFTVPDEVRWQRWREQDAKAMMPDGR
jgi:ectoine hydroxylase-related dioxygenase (phytanoyl-CoA dioxygenase family)